MSIINQVSSPLPISPLSKPDQLPGNSKADFSSILKDSIEELNQAEKTSDLKTEALLNGEINDLHEVMIAAQKASITVETTVQVQKKVIDAYNEIMRMQV